MNSSFGRFLLLYASQTGQSQAIAEEVRDSAQSYNLNADLHCLSKADKEFSIETETVAVIIVSTTGDGEPPDTARKLWRRINKRTLAKNTYAHLRFCLLALGDSNYSTFCNFGKQLDKRLQEIGANHFLDTAYADDAVGLETIVEPWLEALWPAVKREVEVNYTPFDTNLIAHMELSGEKSLMTEYDNPVSNTKMQSTIKNDLSSHTDDKKVETNLMTSMSALQINSSNEAETNCSGSTIKDISSECGATYGNSNHLVHSLTSSAPPLCSSALSLPVLAPAFLKLSFSSSQNEEIPIHSYFITTASNGQPITYVPIKSASQLTTKDAVKAVLEITIDISSTSLQYCPGDYVYIACQNEINEINKLIHRLGLEYCADDHMTVEVIVSSKKREIKYFSELPLNLTLKRYLLYHCDVRSPPKKLFLRMLSEHTKSPQEKRRLQELCSHQGIDDYTRFVRSSALSLLELLSAFPSCHPPVDRLLEHLPKLQPRPYSVASSQKVQSSMLRFAFTLVQVPGAVDSENVKSGICTGWLENITKQIKKYAQQSETAGNCNVDDLGYETKIPIFLKSSVKFHLPQEASIPVIMIAAGAGIAPFIGFLQHREHELKDSSNSFGEMWLFYGCRHKDRDFLYRNELEEWKRTRTLTRLHVTFSREVPRDNQKHLKYVQHAVSHYGSDVASVIQEGAKVYVCGDAQNMAKGVEAAIHHVLMENLNMKNEEAEEYIKEMKSSNRYLQDIWT